MSHSKKNLSVFLYLDYPSSSLKTDEICERLNKFGITSCNRGDFYSYLNLSESEINELSENLSQIAISDIEREYAFCTPDIAQIKFESGIIRKHNAPDIKRLYDGHLLNSLFFRALLNKHADLVLKNEVHIVFTSRLFCTFGDKRYHARVLLTGIPSLISTTGLVEAPAKPREYYWLKASFIQSGKDLKELNEIYTGRIVEYDDPKITDILYSYALQVIFYNITGNPFCDDKQCCLYNSHWQEEVLKAQLSGELCSTHCEEIKNYILV